MEWKYNDYLLQKLNNIKDVLSLNDFSFEICDEQDFVKMRFMAEKKIYILVKFLTSSITLDAKTQPVQIMIMSEQNSLGVAKTVFETFASQYNYAVEVLEDGTFIKQQYTQPVVLSNFNEAGNGFRSVLYMSCTMLIIEQLMDIYTYNGDEIVRGAITINNEIVRVLSFNMAYSMTPNTQPIPPSRIASSVKSVSTFSITFTLPPRTVSSCVNLMVTIMTGSVSGNSDFVVDFWLGDNHFENITMRMIANNLVSGPNQVPGMQIGLMR